MHDEEMTIDERYKYLRMMQKRYLEAGRVERGRLLDEMEVITGLHRKSLIRSMQGGLVRKKREKQRGSKYDFAVEQAIRVISRSMDHPCAERLQPNLGWMARHLIAHGELVITPEVLQKLDQISVSSVQRCLNKMIIERKLPRRRAEEANRWRREVPARRIAWDEQEPGHFEVDLVHHCGITASGQYVHTLQMVDVATGWSERVAVLGRSYLAIQDGFERILARLPFRVKEIHPDNGSEFFNDHLMTFWYGQSHPLQFSRSRPWHKNDNRFVEQKNDTLVRAYLGYRRLDTVDQTNLLNHLYDLMWIYHNFFQPVMRIKEKSSTISSNHQFRLVRRFDRAQTPLDRLRRSGALDETIKADLLALRKQINPLRLRELIYELIHFLLNLPEANESNIQNVHQTLGLWKCGQQAAPHFHKLDDPILLNAVSALYSDRKERILR
ncbi:MAG: integrase [Candidatus Kryptoniota bacterium]